ncbi:hypothetical protein FNV43_RR17013 [Rhamnella rubrinervis]|uniref:Uncharacterized protein n=1 Tax=Rhamnella rubrinervis TaxID=2594499 RepID=A0A8K0ME56_9ROSA|nr:hypothetical protein FNV43_RR17013 [Rhamnella rubrinervis]
MSESRSCRSWEEVDGNELAGGVRKLSGGSEWVEASRKLAGRSRKMSVGRKNLKSVGCCRRAKEVVRRRKLSRVEVGGKQGKLSEGRRKLWGSRESLEGVAKIVELAEGVVRKFWRGWWEVIGNVMQGCGRSRRSCRAVGEEDVGRRKCQEVVGSCPGPEVGGYRKAVIAVKRRSSRSCR